MGRIPPSPGSCGTADETATCTICNKEKIGLSFPYLHSRKVRVYSHFSCDECLVEIDKALRRNTSVTEQKRRVERKRGERSRLEILKDKWAEEERNLRNIEYDTIYKTCLDCGERKAPNKFRLRGNAKDMHDRVNQCTQCINKSSKKKRAFQREQQRLEREAMLMELSYHERVATVLRGKLEHHIKIVYHMSPDQYDEIARNQQGLCAICRNPPLDNAKLVIDHCHETGVVRGLLCTTCNVGLGFFKDNQSSLLRATQYLQKTQWET